MRRTVARALKDLGPGRHQKGLAQHVTSRVPSPPVPPSGPGPAALLRPQRRGGGGGAPWRARGGCAGPCNFALRAAFTLRAAGQAWDTLPTPKHPNSPAHRLTPAGQPQGRGRAHHGAAAAHCGGDGRGVGKDGREQRGRAAQGAGAERRRVQAARAVKAAAAAKARAAAPPRRRPSHPGARPLRGPPAAWPAGCVAR